VLRGQHGGSPTAVGIVRLRTKGHGVSIVYFRSVIYLLVISNAVPSSAILVTQTTEAIFFLRNVDSYKATRRHIQEDGILYRMARQMVVSRVVQYIC
jgi:hypothetical protein